EFEFTDEDRCQISIANNKIYEHNTLQINYTTYDLRREQDSLNPRTRADIMVLSHETDEERHPYWYARIIRIFHVEVWNFADASMTKPQQMNFLFVRWFGRDPTYKSGFSAKRLPRIGFLKGEDPCSFGFIDPDVIIRGIHLIPAFEHGQTDQLLADSFVRREADLGKDWLYFYVNM
ncbi:hypothetical protein CY34DRAFT_100899, partial [Suillus luteus UH-Slu-Lm8-n1]